MIKARAKHSSESWPKEKYPDNKQLRSAALRGVIKLYPNTHRVVRIFTSSTFTDTREERNALMRHVYPGLREFCRERGYELQIVDMRWGVRDEATDDHMTSELCMKEIKHCQRLSTGPSFVTFLGQKYGYRPFPPRIDAAEMTLLLEGVMAPDDVTLLRSWFQEDKNAVPRQFVLLPIRQRLPDYADSDNPQRQKQARERWWQEFTRMQLALRQAAERCLSEEDALKYFFSVTEEEIQNGILKAKNTEKTCYWFKRHLTGLQENMTDKLARRFMDIGTDADDEACRLLNKLKDDLIPSKLPPGNIKTYEIAWTQKGVDPKMEEHAKYLERFCGDFDGIIREMIERGMEERSRSQAMSVMTEELLQHLRFAKEKTGFFVGRQALLERIQDRCTGANLRNRILVVCGEGGSGKTSLMAKIASLLPTWTSPDVPVLLRFLGTTAQTSALKPLLTSLCEQLQMLGIQVNEGNPLPLELKDLENCFKEALMRCEKRVCLILDSLDQLRDRGGVLRDWVPTQLPESVIFILSAIPSTAINIVPTLKNFLEEDCFIDVPPFDDEDNGAAIESWFNKASRTLQQEQMQFLIKACSKVALPLYTRLAFETSVRWRSYTPSDDLVIGESIEDAINVLLKRVERYHGVCLVKRALGYITAAKSGLSVGEIEDVLSLDDDVLNDVYQYHMPPLRRLPPLLWVRIQSDLDTYLTSTGADGTVVVRWFHRQFVEVAHQRYLPDEQTKNVIHETLAEYFLGLYSNDKEKPFRDRKGQEGRANRYVAAQPVTFGDKPSNVDDGDMVNLRKLSELPYHLIKLHKLQDLKSQTLLNFEFLYAKIKAISFDSVMEDFEMAKEAGCWDKEMELMDKSLTFSKDALLRDARHLPTYLLASLTKCIKPNEHKVLKGLLREAASPYFPCLISTQGHMSLSGTSLMCKLVGHSQGITSFDISHDYKKLVSSGSDGTIREWEINTGNQLKEIDTSVAEHYLNMVAETRYIKNHQHVLAIGYGVHRWNLDTGIHMGKIDIPGVENPTEAFVHTDPTRSDAAFLADDKLVFIDTDSMETVATIPVDGRPTMKDATLRVSDYLSGHGAEVVFHRAGSNKVHILNLATYKKTKKMGVYQIYPKEASQSRVAKFAVSSSGLLGILHFSPNINKPGKEVQTMESTLDVVDLRTAKKIHTFSDATSGYYFGIESLVAVGDRKFAAAVYSTKSSTEITIADLDTKTTESVMELTFTFIQKWRSTNDQRVVMVYQNNPDTMEYHDLGVAQMLSGNQGDGEKKAKKEEEGRSEASIMIRVIEGTGSRYALYYNKANRLAVWDLATRRTIRTASICVSMHQCQNLDATTLAGALPTDGKLEVADIKTGRTILSSSRLLYNSPGYNARVGVSWEKGLIIVGPKSYMLSAVDIHSGDVKWSISTDVADKLSGLYVCKDGSIALCEEARSPGNGQDDVTECRLFAFDLKAKSRLPDIRYPTTVNMGTMVFDSNAATLTPDGTYFITGYIVQDKFGVMVWNVREGTSTNLKVETPVSTVAYSPVTDCIILAAGVNEGIQLYRLSDLTLAGTIGDIGEGVSQIWLSPDGSYCATIDPRMRCDLHIIDIVKKKKMMTYRSSGEVAGCLFADHNKFLLLAVRNTPDVVQYYLHPGGTCQNQQTCAEQRRLATLAKQPDLFGKFQHFDLAAAAAAAQGTK